jgi:hypothetical protein
MEITTERCEIALALRYAFWEYPAVRGLIDETCSGDGDLHLRLDRRCTEGAGEYVTPHQYWLCPEHAALLHAIDNIVVGQGDTPLSIALSEE